MYPTLRHPLTSRLAAGLLLSLASLLTGAGCFAVQPGTTVITQNVSDDPILQKAARSGEYKVFVASSPTDTATAQVNRGEWLGFRKTDERWIAVAGSQQFDMPKSGRVFRWNLQDGR